MRFKNIFVLDFFIKLNYKYYRYKLSRHNDSSIHQLSALPFFAAEEAAAAATANSFTTFPCSTATIGRTA